MIAKKATQVSEIPVKLIKEHQNLTACSMQRDFDNAPSDSKHPTCLKQGSFTLENQVKNPCLKYVDITQILKANGKFDRTNYKP